MTQKIEDILGAITPNVATQEIATPAETAMPATTVTQEVTENPVNETGGLDGSVTMNQALEDILAQNGVTMADYNLMNSPAQQGMLTRARKLFKERLSVASNAAYDALPHYMFLSNGEKYHTRAEGTLLAKVQKNIGVRYELIKGQVGFFPEPILLEWERKRLLHELRGEDPAYNSAILNDFYAKVAKNEFINDYQRETARDRYGVPWGQSPHNKNK